MSGIQFKLSRGGEQARPQLLLKLDDRYRLNPSLSPLDLCSLKFSLIICGFKFSKVGFSLGLNANLGHGQEDTLGSSGS